jgi:hypothetical protein
VTGSTAATASAIPSGVDVIVFIDVSLSVGSSPTNSLEWMLLS